MLHEQGEFSPLQRLGEIVLGNLPVFWHLKKMGAHTPPTTGCWGLRMRKISFYLLLVRACPVLERDLLMLFCIVFLFDPSCDDRPDIYVHLHGPG